MPPELLTAAMGFSRSTTDSARIAGAIAGAGLLAAFGVGPAYVAVTGFYCLAALLMLGVDAARRRPLGLTPGASAWREVWEGLVQVWHTPRLLAIIWLAFQFNLTAFPVTQGLLPYVARNVYQSDETGLGYLLAGFATGALAGSIALGRFGTLIRLPPLLLAAAVAWYLLLLIFAHMQSLPAGTVTLVLAGFAQSLAVVALTVILLRDAAPAIRGRIMGVRMLAIYSLPVSMLAAGALVEWIGFFATVSLYAATGLGLTLLTAWHWREVMLRKP
jgi:Na+/melibiose symporter-like transporter